MRRIWEKLTQRTWDDAMQTGTEIGYLAGIQASINYIDALIATGDYGPHEELLEAMIEDLQGTND